MLTRKVSEWSNTEYRNIDKGMETIFVGRSLYVARETVQVMSDVWDEEMFLYSIRDDGTLSRDCVGYYGDKPEDNPVYEIDATAEAFELYRAKQEADKYESLVHNTNSDLANPAFKGRVVKVVRGRNTPVGKVGKVVVVIERPYGMGYRSAMRPKLGLATSSKMVDKVMPNGKVFKNHADMIWVWAHNCDVEKPEPVDFDVCRKIAFDHANFMVRSLRETQKLMPGYRSTNKVA